MKRTFMLLAASAAAALTLVPAASAASGPSNRAHVIGIEAGDGATATVRVRYTCDDGMHLWVSAKQVADRSRNPILQGEGSSQHAAAWLQRHPSPGQFTCDGRPHTGTFEIDTAETDPRSGESVGHGELERGHAWVQFCMYGPGTFISESSWERVR